MASECCETASASKLTANKNQFRDWQGPIGRRLGTICVVCQPLREKAWRSRHSEREYMALLTDGNSNDTEALRVYESSILRVADVESINLDVKLRLSTEEIAQDVLDVLIEQTSPTDPQALMRRQKGVSDVAVSSQMKRWHALHTLETVYRDAYNNQLNDRYRMKWEEYQELGRDARERTLRYGIGLVANPLPIPGLPQFGIALGSVASTTYYVQGTWVSAQGQESTPSRLTNYTTVANSLLTVLLPNPPAAATGWNVYVGVNPWPLALQNTAPLALGSVFTLSATGPASGPPPGDGQTADTYVSGGTTLRRG